MDDRDVARAQLAVEVPSLEKGTWRVSPDGAMEMIWNLRPNVKWHDGAPFTSADLLFSYTVHKDPDMTHAYLAERRNMESASAPDPLTFVVRWSRILVTADQARGLTPLPRHLLEDLYQSDRAGFVSSPQFTSEFIGLGPYRLVRWEQSSHMELARFDDYYLGRPPLDRVILRYVFDPNAMVANVLAGAVDVLVPPTIDIDAAVQLKERWEGSGNTVRVEPVSRFIYGELQFRPELARPANLITNRTAREGLYRAINRQGHSDVMTHGMGPIADSWYWPNDAFRPQLESAIPQYPYDPGRARQLLAQVGWAPGGDGVLVHQPSGERLDIEVWSIPQVGERPATLFASDLRAIGADARIYAIPAARSDDREHQVVFPAIEMTGINVDTTLDRFDGRDIASAANRWSGRNRAAYQSARADELLDQLRLTIDPRTVVSLRRDHVQTLMGDIALMPVYWEVQPSVTVSSVKGDISPTNPGWNAFTWDKT